MLADTASHLAEVLNADAAEPSEEELRALVDDLPVGIVVRWGDTIAYANRALGDMFGRAPAALVGRRVVELARAEFKEALCRRMAAADRGEPQPPFEFRFDRPDGRVGTIEISATRRVAFGGRAAVMVTCRDVSEERALRDRLLMSDRMAAVATLAAGLAHEINNPLACVTANLELLREELALRDAAGELAPKMSAAELVATIADAREGAERVRLVVRDLRLFARGDGAERGPVDISAVLDSAERMAAGAVKARARVVRRDAPLPPVDGSATRLCQVFVHILVNAAQAIAAGAPEDHEVRVSSALERGFVVVEVRDSGPGIPAELRARIFDPFFSTKGIGGGQGLGLSVCHGIVTSLGGRISVEDAAPERGTIVRVALPVYGPA